MGCRWILDFRSGSSVAADSKSSSLCYLGQTQSEKIAQITQEHFRHSITLIIIDARAPDSVERIFSSPRFIEKPTMRLCFVFVLAIVAMTTRGIAADKPNVVYMMADDVGWGDLSVHGGGVPTPHIDKLFSQGVELSRFMGWCVCSPTRAMLLTARHPFRVGTGPEVGGELDLNETTIAEGFKANGYRTGVFGKWHNGNDPDSPEYRLAFLEAFKNLPNKKPTFGYGANAHGFDEAWVYYGGGADYFTRRTVQGRGPVSWWHNGEFRPNDEGYTEDLITRHAVEFIREKLGLTGTHVGCDTSQCGACVVLVNGKAVKSCTALAIARFSVMSRFTSFTLRCRPSQKTCRRSIRSPPRSCLLLMKRQPTITNTSMQQC